MALQWGGGEWQHERLTRAAQSLAPPLTWWLDLSELLALARVQILVVWICFKTRLLVCILQDLISRQARRSMVSWWHLKLLVFECQQEQNYVVGDLAQVAPQSYCLRLSRPSWFEYSLAWPVRTPRHMLGLSRMLHPVHGPGEWGMAQVNEAWVGVWRN